MKYILDTNVVVDLLRRKVRFKEEFLEEGSGISVITRGELVYGAYKSDRPKENLRLIKGLIVEARLQVLDINEEIIDRFGELKVELEQQGRRLEDFDLLIAATAINLGLTLVTSNVKHFARIKGLKMLTV